MRIPFVGEKEGVVAHRRQGEADLLDVVQILEGGGGTHSNAVVDCF